MTYFDNICNDVKYSILLNTPYEQVFDAAEAMKYNVTNEPNFWKMKAIKDFPQISEDSFYLCGYPSMQSDRHIYEKIKNYVPSDENMYNLRLLAPHWSTYSDDFLYIYDYLMNPLFTTKPMSADEVQTFIENGADDLSYQTFIPSSHLYLQTHHTHIYNEKELKYYRKTLIRGSEDDSITYLEILKATRILLPSHTESCFIESVNFSGFSEDGIPILTFSFDY